VDREARTIWSRTTSSVCPLSVVSPKVATTLVVYQDLRARLIGESNSRRITFCNGLVHPRPGTGLVLSLRLLCVGTGDVSPASTITLLSGSSIEVREKKSLEQTPSPPPLFRTTRTTGSTLSESPVALTPRREGIAMPSLYTTWPDGSCLRSGSKDGHHLDTVQLPTLQLHRA